MQLLDRYIREADDKNCGQDELLWDAGAEFPEQRDRL